LTKLRSPLSAQRAAADRRGSSNLTAASALPSGDGLSGEPGTFRAPARQALRLARRIRAWMLVPPVDAALLLLPALWTPSQWKATAAMAALSLALLTGGGRYRARLHMSVLDELPSIVGKLLTAAAVIATVIALRHEQDSVMTFLGTVATVVGLVIGGRIITTQMIELARRHRLTVHQTVIIGTGPVAMELFEILRDNPRYGLYPVGLVDEGAERGSTPAGLQVGDLTDLDDIVAATGTDVLLVADGNFAERDLLDAVRTPSCVPCDLLLLPRLHQFHTQAGLPDHIGSIPIMRIRTPSLHGPARLVKRSFDVLVASVALIVVLPVLAACALAVRLEGGPGVIFKQPRVGRDGVVFDCLKLRSMRPSTAAESATQWSVAADDRVGKVGRLLRRTSLDELPQLWNILRGDMTLVGPRPERPHFVSRFSQEFDRYNHRHRVQAGLTGLAQVSGLRGDTSIADRARYDNYYIENWSLWLDFKIIVRTFAEVLFARGR
jgi:exopolysaccharide biosynthesis polyprenyl glycosylphosphotransferase